MQPTRNPPIRKTLRMIAATCGSLLLAACAMGPQSRYSCGIPDGPACQSVLATYAQTSAPGAPISPPGARSTPSRSPDRTAVRLAQTPEGDLVFEPDPLVATQSPAAALVEREPAIVMRIWIAPWQDAQGDLHGATYRYTEIAPARWRHGRMPADPPRTFFRVAPAAGSAAATSDTLTNPAAEEAP
jgi:conjugal transfer pilus assembly protein TraV